MSEHSFKRNKCGCASCTSHCERQPGMLIPGDLERITSWLREHDRADELDNFVASPGAIAASSQTGRKYQIPTITPSRKADGSCVFLDTQRRCTIHEVSPFGCAYFDEHLTGAERQRRSLWAHREIATTPEYHALRSTLVEVDRDGRRVR